MAIMGKWGSDGEEEADEVEDAECVGCCFSVDVYFQYVTSTPRIDTAPRSTCKSHKSGVKSSHLYKGGLSVDSFSSDADAAAAMRRRRQRVTRTIQNDMVKDPCLALLHPPW